MPSGTRPSIATPETGRPIGQPTSRQDFVAPWIRPCHSEAATFQSGSRGDVTSAMPLGSAAAAAGAWVGAGVLGGVEMDTFVGAAWATCAGVGDGAAPSPLLTSDAPTTPAATTPTAAPPAAISFRR